MLLPPRMHKPNATIILKKLQLIQKIIPKFEKSLPLVCWACQNESINILDVDPRRDDDASPMSYRCMLRPTWMLISALQHKSKFNFELFWKIIQFFGFHAVVLVKTFPLMYQLLMQDLYRRSQGDFLFSGYGQTDTVLESSYGNMSAHKKFQLKAQN